MLSQFLKEKAVQIEIDISFLMYQRIEVAGQAITPQKGYSKAAYWKWKALLELGKHTSRCLYYVLLSWFPVLAAL